VTEDKNKTGAKIKSQQVENLKATGSRKVPTAVGTDLIVEIDALSAPDSKSAVEEAKPAQVSSLNEVLNSEIVADAKSAWQLARNKVEKFKPLPWFIWRLSNSVFTKTSGQEEINEGMLLGLRRLVFAAASDPVLGTGSKVNILKKALTILRPDVIAAVAILHCICKRLPHFGNQRVWQTMLDDGLINSQIGFEVGRISKNFSLGRALLAGSASKIGLAILVATGDSRQAQELMEEFSTGRSPESACLKVYGCDASQIAAVLLAYCGCGTDSASGISQSNLSANSIQQLSPSVAAWAASSKVIKILTDNKDKESLNPYLNILGAEPSASIELTNKSKQLQRNGHSWEWLV
jgi:hypothetical protein